MNTKEITARAKAAARLTRNLSIETRDGVLMQFACNLRSAEQKIIAANQIDLENARLNGVQEHFQVLVGDLSDQAEGRYDIITANIVAAAILSLAPDLPSLMGPDTLFIASGIIDQKKDEVIAGLQKVGLQVVDVREKRGWECILARKA